MGQGPKDQPSFQGRRRWKVQIGEDGVRLDNFIRRRLPHLSLREIRGEIEGKNFWIGTRPGRKGDRLFSGDFVSFRGAHDVLAAAPLPQGELKVPILREDEFILVLDKPAGMAVHGFSGKEKRSVANFLIASRPLLSKVGKNPWEPGLVHRLDRDTSGVLLVAKNQGAYENLRTQFRKGEIEKKYWALVWGRARKSGRIDVPLAHDPRNRSRMMVLGRTNGNPTKVKSWNAATEYRRISFAQRFSLLEVAMKTGVTHQIRAHLESIGHPLLGDPLYGKGCADPFKLKRHFLHAFYVKFRHPKSGLPIVIESSLPEELHEVLKRLRISF